MFPPTYYANLAKYFLSLAPCLVHECKNGGTCHENKGVAKCECTSGKRGKNCENEGKSYENVYHNSSFIQ